jgi:hypothetical protein
MATYRCSVCASRAEIIDGEIVRSCQHLGEGVDASVHAVATGDGGAGIGVSTIDRLRSWLRSLVRAPRRV